MRFKIPDIKIKSIVITPTSTGNSADGQVLVDFKSRVTVVVSDQSPAGTNQFEWLNIPDFTKYFKIVCGQIYYAGTQAAADALNPMDLITPSSRNSLIDPEVVTGWEPSLYAIAGPSHKYIYRYQALLPSRYPGARDVMTGRHDDYAKLEIYDDDGWPGRQRPDLRVGCIELKEISLEAAKSPTFKNPTFAAQEQSDHEMSFQFEFDLLGVVMDPPPRNNQSIENMTHLVFMEFDFYQALEDAGVRQDVLTEGYRRNQETLFSTNLSCRAKIIRSITDGRKTPTLTYYSFVDGTPYSGTINRINGILYAERGERLIERTIRNDKVFYLDPFLLPSYPSYDQMLQSARVMSGYIDNVKADISDYRKVNNDSTRSPIFSIEQGSVNVEMENGENRCILNINLEEQKEISDESRYPPITISRTEPDIFRRFLTTITLDFDRFFLQQSKYYQIYKNIPNRSQVLANFVDSLKVKLDVFEQEVEYVNLEKNYKNNVVVAKKQNRNYMSEENYNFEISGTTATISFISSIDNDAGLIQSVAINEKNTYTSYIYGCEVQFVDPVMAWILPLIKNVRKCVEEMEDFYSIAMIPSFGLKNETSSATYGLGSYPVHESDEEYPGSVNIDTGLYTEDFAGQELLVPDDAGGLSPATYYTPVTVQGFHDSLESGVINTGIQTYLELSRLIFGTTNQPDVVNVNDLTSLLRVNPANTPLVLGNFIDELKSFLSLIKFIFGEFPLNLDIPDLKKMTSSIIKYDRLFEKRVVSKSENTVELYDSNDIVKQIIIDERAHEVEEWWK